MNVSASALRPVVVTRAEASDGALSTQLRDLGLTVLLWPATRTDSADTQSLAEALQRVQDFNWIVFASRHAVAAVLQLLPTQPRGVQIAAVGSSTAQVLRQRGWKVDLVPDQAEAGALVTELAAHLKPGMHVLYPASSRALPTIAKGLAQLEVAVRQVEAYRTESAKLDVVECRTWIERKAVGAVTFASPSAVVELEQALGKSDFSKLLDNSVAVAIGPTTARALTERGRTVVLAESANLAGLAKTALRVIQTRQ